MNDDGMRNLICKKIRTIDQMWFKIGSGVELNPDEALAALDAATCVGVAFAEPCLAVLQEHFQEVAHEAGERDDLVLGGFVEEIWRSLKVVPNGFEQLADVTRQIDNRMKLVGRVSKEDVACEDQEDN